MYYYIVFFDINVFYVCIEGLIFVVVVNDYLVVVFGVLFGFDYFICIGSLNWSIFWCCKVDIIVYFGYFVDWMDVLFKIRK